MTIKEVAKRAGVSISTVSRVINNSAKVSKDIKKRVEKIIEETGYRPNSLARGLINDKTNVIGVILPRIDLEIFAAAVEGLTKKLNELGYHILLANSRAKVEEELEYFKVFEEKRVDGVVWFATGITKEHRELLKKMNYPVVLLGQEDEILDCPSVIYDNYNGVKKITNYLIELGHRNISFIGVPEFDKSIGLERKRGFKDTLEMNGIEVKSTDIVEANFDYMAGYDNAEKIFKSNEKVPTAIVAATDRLAIGVIRYLLENGYRVPEDISVAGIDDLRMASIYTPSLTTINYNHYQSGVHAADLIIDQVEKRESSVRRIVLDYKLKIRNSTKKIGGENG
ncbi:MAG: LacI family DNA-binding transcriptional regulator [Fusobacteriota bacterium]